MVKLFFVMSLFVFSIFAEQTESELQKKTSAQKTSATKTTSETPANDTQRLEMPKESTTETTSSSKKQRAQVLKWDKRRDRIAITDDSVHSWARKDSVCVFRTGRAIACGKVIAVGIKGAVVQLLNHAAAVKPGDEAHYYEPEKKIPEISDDEVSADNLMESNPLKYSVTIGGFIGLDLLYPVLNFYIAVSPNVAIGIQPTYIKKTGDVLTSTLSGYGGALTVSYFGDQYFRGMWLELGSGFYHLTAEQSGVQETINAPLVFGLIGWHEDWAHGLNLGAGIGARFLSPLQVTTDPTYHSLHPMAQVELGFSF